MSLHSHSFQLPSQVQSKDYYSITRSLQSLLPALVAAASGVRAQDSSTVALVMADNACWAEFSNLLGCNGRSSEPIGDWDGTHCTDTGNTDVSVCDSGHVMFKYESGQSPLGPLVLLEANTLVFQNEEDTYPMPFKQPDPGCSYSQEDGPGCSA